MHAPGSIHGSPSRKKIKAGDRFIPNRTGVDLLAAFNLETVEAQTQTVAADTRKQRTEEANRNFTSLLRSELFGDTIRESASNDRNRQDFHYTVRCKTPPRSTSPVSGTGASTLPSTPKSTSRSNLFSYMSPSARNRQQSGQHTPTRTNTS
jgi:cell division cycle 20-like protein 1 (cofactor of APC complex)